MWTVLSPNFKKQYPNGVIAYRGKVDSSAIGNPFSVTNRGEDTVKQFIEWIITGNNFGVETILMGGKNYKLSDLRNEYINIIKKAKGEKILYYNELGRPSHATALDYLINKYDWNKQSKVSTPQVNQNITYTKLLDRNIKLGISEKTNNSGGAKGSDAYWNYESTIIDASNMNWHNQDMVDRAKQGLEKDLVLNLLENNKQALIKDESEYAKVVSIGGKRLGKTAKNPSVINKLGRNWYQVKNSDGIYAIIENFYTRPDTGQLDMSNVSGGTGWAIAYAAEKIDGIERLIYVYNQKDSKWYKYNYNTNVFEVYNDTPILTNKYAGIGTRNLKDNGKQAIKDVYNKTVKSQQPETQTKERIQKVYPEQIKLNSINIKVSTSKLQELANLIPNEIVEITWKNDEYIVNSVLKPLKDTYGIHAETYVEETNSDISKNEGEFLLNNPEFAKYFIEDYLSDEEGDGKTMQEYAQKLIDKNVTYKDTYQLSLFDNYDEGSGFNKKCNTRK